MHCHEEGTVAGTLKSYTRFHKELSSRPSSKTALFLDLFLSNSNTKSSLIVP